MQTGARRGSPERARLLRIRVNSAARSSPARGVGYLWTHVTYRKAKTRLRAKMIDDGMHGRSRTPARPAGTMAKPCKEPHMAPTVVVR